MSPDKKEKLKKLLATIDEDVRKDIAAFEGKPFDGRSVSTLFGYQAAAITGLIRVINKILEDE